MKRGTFGIIAVLFSLTFLSLTQASAQTSGLIAHYTFDDGSVSGKIGQAKEFNGTSDYVSVSGLPQVSSFTVSAWIYPTKLGDGQEYHIAAFAGTQFALNSKSRLVTSNFLSSATLSTNTWYLVTYTADANGQRLYVNGAEVGSSATTVGPGTSACIGRKCSTGVYYFSGLMDDVRFYDRVLSLSEISGLYSVGTGTLPPVNQDNPPPQDQPPADNPPAPYTGTTHYVRPGSQGDGSNWSQALPELPATLLRGHTYYIGGGNYPRYIFDDPETGSEVITIKKATLNDHGTDVGWNSDYSHQAVFFSPETTSSQIIFKTGYYVFDGNGTHSVPSKNPGDYGFKIHSDSSSNISGIVSIQATNITLRYTHVYNTTNGSINNGTVAIRFLPPAGNVKIQNSYIQNSGKDGLQISSSNNVLVERSYIERLGRRASGEPDYHGQTVQIFTGGSDIIFRWNIWEANEGQGLIQIAGMYRPSERIRFYGNVVFVGTGGTTVIPGFNVGGGIVGNAWTYNPISDIVVYNNSIVNVGAYGGGAGFPIRTPGVNLFNYNNLLYNAKSVTFSGWTEYGYHASGGGDPAGGSNEQKVLPSSIFKNYAGNDFRLMSGTEAGLSLSSESWWNSGSNSFLGATDSSLDMFGNTRGQDGVWDRGAYEYVGAPGQYVPPQVVKAGDFNKDGVVNSLDLSLMAGAWNTANATYDLSKDGTVNTLDYSIMVRNWTT